MPQYKKLALHNSVCNEVFFRVQDCDAEHPFSRFLGACTDFTKQLDKCIKENRERMREKNRLESRPSQMRREQQRLS